MKIKASFKKKRVGAEKNKHSPLKASELNLEFSWYHYHLVFIRLMRYRRYMSIRILIYFLRLKIMKNHDERRNSRCRCINKPFSKGSIHRSKVFDLELGNILWRSVRANQNGREHKVYSLQRVLFGVILRGWRSFIRINWFQSMLCL